MAAERPVRVGDSPGGQGAQTSGDPMAYG